MAKQIHRNQQIIRNPFRYHLITSYTFVELEDIEIDPTDPYANSISAFKAFTKRVLTALFRSTYWYHKLHKIYDGLPTARNEDAYQVYRAWVKDATMKHPQRRTAQQHMWLYIVKMQTTQPTRSIQSMVNGAISRKAEWKTEAYDVDNLRVDPDKNALYFFTHIKSVRRVVMDEEPDLDTACLICTEDFDADNHPPGRGPCGHLQCKGCFEQSLNADSTKYICPFCRACLVCGRNDCVDHVVAVRDRDEHLPIPLPRLLERSHMLCMGQLWHQCLMPLYGLSPKRYWELREKTRETRSSLTRIQEYMEVEDDAHHFLDLEELWRRYLNDIEDVAIRVRQEHRMDNRRTTE
jgi:hypothetical protein